MSVPDRRTTEAVVTALFRSGKTTAGASEPLAVGSLLESLAEQAKARHPSTQRPQ